MALPTYTVPGTATYDHPQTGVPQRFVAGDVIPLETAILYGMPNAAALPDVTATADGTGTGVVPAGVPFVTVASADATHIVTLPTPVVGRLVCLRNGATGYELRSHDPENVAINGGSGAAAESAIPADTLVACLPDTATTWVCQNTATDGTTTATEAAAP